MCRRLRFLLDFKRVVFRTQLLFVCLPFLSVFLYLSFLMPVCLRLYLKVCMCTRLCAYAYFYLWDRTDVEQDGRTEKERKGGSFFLTNVPKAFFFSSCVSVAGVSCILLLWHYKGSWLETVGELRWQFSENMQKETEWKDMEMKW